MNDPGKIQDHKLDELFNQLISRKIIISLNVVKTGYEHLTFVVGTQNEPDGKYLLIDRPDGFSKAVKKGVPWNLRFNFNGPDRLEYLFATTGGDFSGGNLKIPFPPFVERLQRRRDFRVGTLCGTKMVFVSKDMKGVIGLINISLGGAYGVVMKHNLKSAEGPLFEMNQQIHKLGIIFPACSGEDEQVIVVDKAEVRRIEHDKDRHIYKYAFEFMEMDKAQKRKLTQVIYNIQRYFLKNR